jgi:hypothetical protein
MAVFDFALRGPADSPLEQKFTLGLGQTAPDAVRLTYGQCVRATLCDHWALAAHLFGAHLTLSACTATFAVRMEEHSGIDAPAQA